MSALTGVAAEARELTARSDALGAQASGLHGQQMEPRSSPRRRWRCAAAARRRSSRGATVRTQVGFDDAKSEDRVPDRLEHYPGVGVRIADNRGTCAQSGFCTDRLPSVFRTDAEPFVAPAGGRIDEILRAGGNCQSGALSATAGGGDPPGRCDSEREPAVEVSKDGPHRLQNGLFGDVPHRHRL
jgi:uncharacterized Fe-S cluster protein YjdI